MKVQRRTRWFCPKHRPGVSLEFSERFNCGHPRPLNEPGARCKACRNLKRPSQAKRTDPTKRQLKIQELERRIARGEENRRAKDAAIATPPTERTEEQARQVAAPICVTCGEFKIPKWRHGKTRIGTPYRTIRWACYCKRPDLAPSPMAQSGSGTDLSESI